MEPASGSPDARARGGRRALFGVLPEGSHGEGWVVAQLLLLILAAAATLRGPMLPSRLRPPARRLGLAAIPIGGGLFVAGLTGLGRDLTPLPRPRDGAGLRQRGAYGLVRHPVYSGGVLAAFGWALVRCRWPGLLGALALLLFFDAKATREEVWLAERFPEYAEYRRSVAKLIPGVY